MASAGHGSEQARQAQDVRLVVDTIPTLAWSARSNGSADFFNQRWLDYTGLSAEQALDWGWKIAIHPDDLARMLESFQAAVDSGKPFEVEGRLRRSDGEFRWFLFRGNPLLDESGRVVKWYGTNTDLEERKRAEQALRLNEQSLRLIIDSIPGFVSTANAAGEIELVNRQILEYFGKTTEEFKNWATSDHNHPDDLPRMIETYRHAIETGQPLDLENRSRGADGVYRWFHLRGRPQRDAEGRIARWYNLATDIDERKKAEEELRRSKAYLTEAQRLSRTGSFGCRLSTGEMFWSEETFRIYGYDRSTQPAVERVLQRVHPEDRALVQERIDRANRDAKDCDVECRLLLPDDSVKHVRIVVHASKNESGIIEFIGAVMDVTAQRQARAELEKAFEEIKRLKDRLHDENVVLREQIDQAFMFEEIVGSSPALKTVLSSIVKVAPTDSTVLITGETGTGKELIARAIHKGSQRAAQAFISVNCAAIPSSLIASELFGHEKGAFTGALQRRQGRFELAHSGTIFLDEIGELPAETQIALLRVLQERQFERVGGSRVIPTDVRIIAATNRDLSAAIAAGAFRADLFYRLNVFPIHVPPLRNRKEDIPMLVEYFVKRYAEKARRQISRIDNNTLKLCQTYHWPGNIRELQNIVERSAILCTGDTFWIDQAWLSSQNTPRAESSGPLTQTLQSYEKELIEAALVESKGKVAGPNGAAAKLGIPRSTLDLKIKQLNIKKHTIQ
jgi:PAS domain S-box-containing protein